MVRAKRNPLPKVTYLGRVDEPRKAQIDEFLEKVGVKVKDYDLINRALSHKSYTNELGYSHNEQYEKLEFFGDGVLGLIVNEYLFKAFPDYEEGELAKIKSAVVSEVTLASIAKDIELGTVILIGRGESRSGGTERPSLLADILEAFIGALFIDQGLPAARRFVIRYLESAIRTMSTERSTGDYKSFLQETIQKECGVRPVYSLNRATGPDHSKIFKVAVLIKGKQWGTGTGKSKKEAEQDGAENALHAWEAADKSERDAAPVRGRGRGRGGEKKEPAKASGRAPRGGREPKKSEPRAAQPRGGGAGRRGQAPRSPRKPRPEKPREEFIAPADIDDPIAWAAGEVYVPRRRSSTNETKETQ